MNDLDFYPLTLQCWGDFEALFGERGAYSGCWCMWWRMSSAAWNTATKEERKQAMRAIVASGQVPGILAYRSGQAVGWCSLGPRKNFPRILRSPKLVPLDDIPTWSVNCFYVDKSARSQGVMIALLRAAVEYAVGQGALRVEGYPAGNDEGHRAPVQVFTGVSSVFQKVGFEIVEAEVGGKMVRRYVYLPK